MLEEHVKQGSLGQMLSHDLMLDGSAPRVFRHFAAKGYLTGRYGSQNYHRAECGIDGRAVIADIDRLTPRP